LASRRRTLSDKTAVSEEQSLELVEVVFDVSMTVPTRGDKLQATLLMQRSVYGGYPKPDDPIALCHLAKKRR
jgi:hypothetical protein